MGGITKSLWELITGSVLKSSLTGSERVPIASQPGTPFVSEINYTRITDIFAAGIDLGFILLQQSTAQLNDSAIIALPTQPLTIVPGTPDRYIIPLMSVWELDCSAGAYSGFDAGGSLLGIGVDNDKFSATQPFIKGSALLTDSVSGFLGSGSKVFAIQPAARGTMQGIASLVDGSVSCEWRQPTINPSSDWLGSTLKIFADNGVSGNYGGGNIANKMAVTLFYCSIAKSF